MTLTPKEISQEIEAIKPRSFEQLMAGILTIVLVIFVLVGIILDRQIPDWLIGITGTVIGVWFQRKS